jgi:hypothetical protein
MKTKINKEFLIKFWIFCFRDAFADLMSSGTLTSQSHISIPSSSQDFSSVIKTICQSYRLTGW